jgi:hypothetical protein
MKRISKILVLVETSRDDRQHGGKPIPYCRKESKLMGRVLRGRKARPKMANHLHIMNLFLHPKCWYAYAVFVAAVFGYPAL